MDAEIFFTIISPVKNGSAYVDSFINTLLYQYFTSWECIIIDDQSSDNTFDSINSRVTSDDRFRLYKNPAVAKVKGPYSARNYGLTLARGKFICFLDIDDCWSNNHLANYYKILKQSPTISLIYSKYYRFSQNKDILITRNCFRPRYAKFLSRFINPIPMLSSCVKRSVLGGSKFPPIYHEDYLFWKSVLASVPYTAVYKIDSITTAYRMSSSSLSGKSKLRTVSWIYGCHRHEGNDKLYAFFLTAVWGLLQICFLILGSTSQQKLKASHSFNKSFPGVFL